MGIDDVSRGAKIERYELGGAAAATNNPEIQRAARALKRLGILGEPFADGKTGLMKALNRGGTATKEIMKDGSDPNASCSDGVTPLMRAAMMLRFDPAKKLIEAGALLDKKDVNVLMARITSWIMFMRRTTGRRC